jgi:aspartate aminotransferase
VTESATVAVSDKVRQLKGQGIDVVDLGGGDPDFPTPAHIVEAAARAMREGRTHYVSSRGIPALVTAIAEKVRADQGASYDPAREIIVTPSGKHAIFSALIALLDPGDQVLIPQPSWVSYEACVRIADGIPVPVPLSAAERFRLGGEALKSLVTARTKAILINTPGNPTGHVMDEGELAAIAEVASAHDLYVITDEIYQKILFDGHRHRSVASLPGMRERTIIVDGFSKTYAMTGWRLGYVAAPARVTAEILKIQQQSVTCAASFVQEGGVAALTGAQECVHEMVGEYATRRELIVKGLNELPGVRCDAPDGAFYAFPDVSGTGMDSVTFATFALEEARVGVTPGAAFGAGGERHVRLSFANSRALIREALTRLGEALSKR